VPTYQYACTECGERLEAVQSFSDPALTECPNCHGKLRKVFNSVGVVFKGSGFYRNDSRAGAGSTSGAPNESKSESKTSESKGGESKGSESKGSESKSSSSDSGSSTSGTSSTSTTSSSSSSTSAGSTKAGAASSS
jgi:putative FmdB family regulatory protein